MSERTVAPVNHLLWGEVHLGETLLGVGLAESKSDLRRLFEQNGVRVNDQRSPDRMLFLNDLRVDHQNRQVIMLRRGQRRFHWLEFTEWETSGAYRHDPSWFHKSGELGGWPRGWAWREWGYDNHGLAAVDGPWIHPTLM